MSTTNVEVGGIYIHDEGETVIVTQLVTLWVAKDTWVNAALYTNAMNDYVRPLTSFMASFTLIEEGPHTKRAKARRM